MSATERAKRHRAGHIGFRHTPERKAMLVAIMHKYGHADLSVTCRMMADEFIDRHLLRPARRKLFADDKPGMVVSEDAEIPEPTCNPTRTK